MTWDGRERRSQDSRIADINQDVSLIKKDVEYIKQFIEEDRERMKEHIESSDTYREKVNGLSTMRDEFNDHKVADRWIQGLIVTSQVGIIGMLIKLVVK